MERSGAGSGENREQLQAQLLCARWIDRSATSWRLQHGWCCSSATNSRECTPHNKKHRRRENGAVPSRVAAANASTFPALLRGNRPRPKDPSPAACPVIAMVQLLAPANVTMMVITSPCLHLSVGSAFASTHGKWAPWAGSWTSARAT